MTKISSRDIAQKDDAYQRGRGAQLNSHNRFLKHQYVTEHPEGLDVPDLEEKRTSFIPEFPRKIVNEVKSPDLPMAYSMNPYQGCEHGCSYCYARVTHEYWGYSAGLDFERKIIVKPDAPKLLAKQFEHPAWKPEPIMLSGNTDCYQPAERKYQLTRQMLEVLLEYKHPVGIITKNSLVLRDLDLLRELARQNLVHVAISITTLDENLRRSMEPRTASSKKRLQVINTLSGNGIPVMAMVAPIIPGLNNHEIPGIVKAVAEHGALAAGYTMVRLNGKIGEIFEDWIRKNFPDRADKVLRQVRGVHGGSLSDHQYGRRMRGDGHVAEAIRDLFRISKQRYLAGRSMPEYDKKAFIRRSGKQLGLFE